MKIKKMEIKKMKIKKENTYTLELRRGGSEFGITTIMKWLKCPYRADMDTKHPLRIVLGTYIGTIYHGFQQVRSMTAMKKTGLSADFDTHAVLFSQMGQAPGISETFTNGYRTAEKLFRTYRAKYKEDFFGKCLGVEVCVEHKDTELTGIIDDVRRVTATKARELSKYFGEVLSPGIYLRDYKVISSKKWVPQYVMSMQAQSYMTLWSSENGKPAEGFIYDFAFKTNPPTFAQYLVKGNPRDHVLLLGLVKKAKEIIAGGIFKNPNHCFDFGEVCPYGPRRFGGNGVCRP